MRGRDRPDTQAAMRKISESLDVDKPTVFRRLLSFQTFVSVLLIVLVIITSTTFTVTMRQEREARERGEIRSLIFEQHARSILEIIQDNQKEAEETREEMRTLLLNIERKLNGDEDL